jgi:ribosome biogenesis GTPase
MKSSVETQVVAANIDSIFIVHAANNINQRRIEREVAQVAAGGAAPVVVLNKCDLVSDIYGVLDEAEGAAPGVPVHAVAGLTGDRVDDLRGYAAGNRTVAFIGASGVGKSTLINRLLGEEILATSAVREDDQRGRHTTTARHLLPLPGGGALIDTPGMRSFGLSDSAAGVGQVFSDIVQLETSCRFSDCSHRGEPGCAVREALGSGELDRDRLDSFHKLNRELEYIESKTNIHLNAARRKVWRDRAKNNRAKMRVRDRFGR